MDHHQDYMIEHYITPYTPLSLSEMGVIGDFFLLFFCSKTKIVGYCEKCHGKAHEPVLICARNLCFEQTSIILSNENFQFLQLYNLSHLTRKPTICICENKDADQLRSNREADQRLCFRYTDSTLPLLLKSEISSF